MVADAVDPEVGLRPLKGFKLDFSANPGFRKVFFSVKCECTTSALLSVEVSEEKTYSEIEKALPSLVERLEIQAKGFGRMSCEMHQRMSLGGSPNKKTQ